MPNPRPLPSSILRRQVLFFDAIRASVDMTLLAYVRLQSTLASGSHHQHSSSILLDAWSLVDTLNRLRVLVRAMPRLKHSAAVVSFLGDLEAVEALRNAVQLLDGEIEKLKDTGYPI